MKFFKKNKIKTSLLSSISLLGLQLTVSTQANAWIWYDSSFKVCNKLGFSLIIQNTGGYQMHTNNDHSKSQEIGGNSCVNIDFSAQWQSNGYDYDDALDFSLISNDREYGKFTIHATSYLNGLTFGLRNNSDFVHLIDGASAASMRSGTGYIELY